MNEFIRQVDDEIRAISGQTNEPEPQSDMVHPTGEPLKRAWRALFGVDTAREMTPAERRRESWRRSSRKYRATKRVTALSWLDEFEEER